MQQSQASNSLGFLTFLSIVLFYFILNLYLCDAPHEKHPWVMREACLNKVLLYYTLWLNENIYLSVALAKIQYTRVTMNGPFFA